MSNRVIVTGSSGQLGSEISKRLVELGREVVGIDMCEGQHTSLVADLTDSVDLGRVQSLFLEENFDLVNNAGRAVFSDPLHRSRSEFLDLLELNLWVPNALMGAFVRGGACGRVVNISSLYGMRVADQRIYINSDRASSEVYAASKAGLTQLTKYYAGRYGSETQQFNVVSPGGVRADISGQTPEFVKAYSSKVPMSRMATGREVASTVGWLIAEAPAYINGQELVVDGGYSVR